MLGHILIGDGVKVPKSSEGTDGSGVIGGILGLLAEAAWLLACAHGDALGCASWRPRSVCVSAVLSSSHFDTAVPRAFCSVLLGAGGLEYCKLGDDSTFSASFSLFFLAAGAVEVVIL